MLHTDFFEQCLSYIRGFLTDFVEPAKGSLTPGDPGGVRIAVRVGEEGGEEDIDMDLDGDRDGEGGTRQSGLGRSSSGSEKLFRRNFRGILVR